MADPYSKLKPRESTPLDERCHCDRPPALYLAHVLTENPVHCALCRGEVAPEKIGFDAETAEALARWNTVFGAVYVLWVDSGAYEHWAESELQSPDSEVNQRGLAARRILANWIPTNYLWFWNESRPESCPMCGSAALSVQGHFLVCEPCSVCV